MASLLLGNLGSALLGPLGGWIGSAVGSYIDNFLFSPKGDDQKGPRIEDLNVTRADPGVPIPLLWGADRLPGIVIASSPLIETANKETVGKGGGQTVTTYTYHVTIDFMVCEGPILGIARIWAEGNLIRGTRYEMETSTSEHPENIGGIPYPDYYKDHLYDPQLIPWSLNRAYSATDEGYTYKMTGDRLSMVRVTDAEALAILGLQLAGNDTTVLYWKDTSTGFYIPLHNDHAYNADRRTLSRPPIRDSFTGTFAGSTGAGSSVDYPTLTIIDLNDSIDPNVLANINPQESFIDVNGWSYVWNQYTFGVDVSSRVCNLYVSFYRDGYLDAVDGDLAGVQISGGYWQWGIADTLEFHMTVDNATQAGGACTIGSPCPIPAGTRYITIFTERALFFPIFGGGHTWIDNVFTASFRRTYDRFEPNVRDWPDYWNLYDAINDFSKLAVLDFKGCDNLTVYHGTYDQLADNAMREALAIELVDTLEEGEAFDIPAYTGRAHIVFDTLQLADFGNRVPNFTFETVQYDDARIAMVLRDMMRRADVDEKYFNLEDLPNEGVESHILGYSVGTKTTYRAAMESIMEAFRVDAAEIGNQLVFRPRDRSFQWEIDWMDLAATEPGKKPDEHVELYYRDRIEMPRSLTVRFKDTERSYNVNTAQYFRQQGPSVQESMMELSAVLPPAHAKAYARDKMRDLWLERVGVKFKLPHKYVYVYPSDIVKINGQQYGRQDIVLKVTMVTRGANGILEVEGVLREQTVYVPAPGEVTNTNMDNSTWTNRPRPIITSPIYTTMRFLDIAPLREVDAASPTMSGFYGVVSGTDGWQGAGIYASVDGGVSYNLVVTWADRAVLGWSVDRLRYHNAELLDFDNSVVVELMNPLDELETITFDQLIAGFNYCLLGSEVLQFRVAERVLGANNRWRISEFVRGRRGTDKLAILDGHQASEEFTMLQSTNTFFVPQSPNYINQPQLYKVVPYGANLADVNPITFTNTGNLTKPFAPVYIRGIRDASDNISVQWIRQDKIGWGWYEGQDAYLSEPTSDHVVEIWNPANTAVVRTFYCFSDTAPYRLGNLTIPLSGDYGYVMTEFNDVSNPTLYTGDFVYTAAMQTADGYTLGNPVNVRVYKTYQGGLGHPGIARI